MLLYVWYSVVLECTTWSTWVLPHRCDAWIWGAEWSVVVSFPAVYTGIYWGFYDCYCLMKVCGTSMCIIVCLGVTACVLIYWDEVMIPGIQIVRIVNIIWCVQSIQFVSPRSGQPWNPGTINVEPTSPFGWRRPFSLKLLHRTQHSFTIQAYVWFSHCVNYNRILSTLRFLVG